jgi:hypothetical protein
MGGLTHRANGVLQHDLAARVDSASKHTVYGRKHGRRYIVASTNPTTSATLDVASSKPRQPAVAHNPHNMFSPAAPRDGSHVGERFMVYLGQIWGMCYGIFGECLRYIWRIFRGCFGYIVGACFGHI